MELRASPKTRTEPAEETRAGQGAAKSRAEVRRGAATRARDADLTAGDGRVLGLALSKGTSIALAVAALLAASACSGGPSDNASSTAQGIKCEGGNACAGLSECATADGKSLCSGENECKGTGYVYTQTQEQCTALQIRNKP